MNIKLFDRIKIRARIPKIVARMPEDRRRKARRRVTITVNDVLALAGLAAFGAGLWWIFPPAGLIGVGVILLGAGVYPWIRGGNHGPVG